MCLSVQSIKYSKAILETCNKVVQNVFDHFVWCTRLYLVKSSSKQIRSALVQRIFIWLLNLTLNWKVLPVIFDKDIISWNIVKDYITHITFVFLLTCRENVGAGKYNSRCRQLTTHWLWLSKNQIPMPSFKWKMVYSGAAIQSSCQNYHFSNFGEIIVC